MAIELHHLNTHGMMESAGKVVDGVVRLKERIAELEARNHRLEEERLMPLPSEPMAGKMNEDAEKLKGFLFKIIDEHKAACRKHPNFCDELIPPGFDFSEQEKRWKKWNDEATTHYACDVFYEEFYEALNAYEQGDKEHALQEFAQCGAVILRIMEMLTKEMGK